MLDAMNEEYNKTENNNLLEKTERLQFYVLPLMQYNLSEELYMKMNARGLPLSVFDNFKAEFTGALRKCKTLAEEKVDLEGGIQNELISHEEIIIFSLIVFLVHSIQHDKHTCNGRIFVKIMIVPSCSTYANAWLFIF